MRGSAWHDLWVSSRWKGLVGVGCGSGVWTCRRCPTGPVTPSPYFPYSPGSSDLARAPCVVVARTAGCWLLSQQHSGSSLLAVAVGSCRPGGAAPQGRRAPWLSGAHSILKCRWAHIIKPPGGAHAHGTPGVQRARAARGARHCPGVPTYASERSSGSGSMDHTSRVTGPITPRCARRFCLLFSASPPLRLRHHSPAETACGNRVFTGRDGLRNRAFSGRRGLGIRTPRKAPRTASGRPCRAAPRRLRSCSARRRP